MNKDMLHSLKEIRPHGAYWFEYGPGEHVVDCHWHDEAEFFIVIEGEVLFQVDTDYFHVRAGEVIFIDGGDIHAGHAMGDSGCKFCAIVFDVNMLASSVFDSVQEKFILPLQEKKRTFPRHMTGEQEWERSLLHHLDQIQNQYRDKSSGYEVSIKGHLYLMLYEITVGKHSVNRSKTDLSDTAKIERLKTVILYIQNNFREPIRIHDLASLIPMSEGHFCRFFKSATRQTPIDYVNNYRIGQAAELLRQRDRQISDIALDVGYDNASYFIRVFRKIMKCSPSEFRQKQLQI